MADRFACRVDNRCVEFVMILVLCSTYECREKEALPAATCTRPRFGRYLAIDILHRVFSRFIVLGAHSDEE